MDAKDLFREEVALARAELRQEIRKVSAAATGFGVTVAAALFAAGCLVVALALGIADLFDWPAWSGFAVVAALLGIVGGLGYMAGRSAISTVQPLPRTVHTVKENFR